MSFQNKTKKQVDKVIETILSYVNSGTTLHISYAPSVIKRAFGVESHIFIQAVEKLKHMIPVLIDGNGSYRKASRSHDWRADVYTFLSTGENEQLILRYDEHFLGRNGVRKRKCNQWHDSMKTT